MSWFEKYTAYQPKKTIIGTTTSWGEWPIVNQRCYKCVHCAFAYGTYVCHCASRTIARVIHGDICVNYLEVSK